MQKSTPDVEKLPKPRHVRIELTAPFGPHAMQGQRPPRGTGTDDTPNNHLFAECVMRNNGFVNSHLLAIEYIERYRDREAFYPKHPDMAEKPSRAQRAK